MDDEGCDYCADHVPAKGYWRCPVCDAEWPDNENATRSAALSDLIAGDADLIDGGK